jgi:high-affinity nickel-transport protein
MVLVDTTDGITMRAAYGWAFLNPVRKICYNLAVTIVSVLVAFGIGGVELLGVAARQLGLSGPFWDLAANFDFETLGIGIIALFLVSWVSSVAY